MTFQDHRETYGLKNEDFFRYLQLIIYLQGLFHQGNRELKNIKWSDRC